MTNDPCLKGSLCGPHSKELQDNLKLIAGIIGDMRVTPLMEDLQVTITKMHKIGSSLPGGSGERPIMFHVMASDIASELVTVMRRLKWWMVVQYPHLNPPEGSNPTDIAKWALLVPKLVLELQHAVQLARSVRSVVYTAQEVIDRPPVKKFLGLCVACNAPMYIELLGIGDDEIPDVYVECCDMSVSAVAMRNSLIERMEDQIVTARDMVGIVNEITGRELTPDAIRAMKRRGLLSRGKDRKHADLFRVGDVTTLLARRTDRARVQLLESGESK